MAVQTLTNENRAEYNAARGVVVEEPPKVEEKAVEAVETPPEPKKKHTVDERLSKMAEQRREAQEKAERLEKELVELRKTQEPADGEPKPEKFTDAVEFGKAYGKWYAAQEIKKEHEKAAKDSAEREQQKVASEWNKRYKKAARDIEDFEDVIMNNPPLSLPPAATTAMFESDVGPIIHYILSKDSEEQERIMSLTPAGQARYIGRLEARIEAEHAAKERKSNVSVEAPTDGLPRRKIAEAPEPIEPVAGRGSTTLGPVDVNGNVTGSFAEFKSAYKKGLIK